VWLVGRIAETTDTNVPVTGTFGALAAGRHPRPSEYFSTGARETGFVTLSDIADGLAVTHEQRERGVAAVDDTDADLPERLAPFERDLPCTAGEAAAVARAFTGGDSVGDAAATAGVAPTTAAKALHLLGVEGVAPLGPTGRRVVADWLVGDLPRTEALALTGGDEAAFALTAFVETHDPLPGAREALDGALSVGEGDPLSDARPSHDEFL
jgi:hypothetical protein